MKRAPTGGVRNALRQGDWVSGEIRQKENSGSRQTQALEKSVGNKNRSDRKRRGRALSNTAKLRGESKKKVKPVDGPKSGGRLSRKRSGACIFFGMDFKIKGKKQKKRYMIDGGVPPPVP